MKRFVIPGLFLLLCVSLGSIALIANAANKSGKSMSTLTKEIPVSNVHEIDVQAVNVEIEIGQPSATAVLEMPEAQLERLNISCANGEFKIKLKEGSHSPKGLGKNRGTVRLTVASLDDIEAGVGASVTVKQPITADKKVELEATTGSSITLVSLTAPALDAEANTGASISINGGAVAQADLEASTGASISCKKLTITDGSAEASTGASISCNIVGRRRISTSTGGSVK